MVMLNGLGSAEIGEIDSVHNAESLEHIISRSVKI